MGQLVRVWSGRRLGCFAYRGVLLGDDCGQRSADDRFRLVDHGGKFRDRPTGLRQRVRPGVGGADLGVGRGQGLLVVEIEFLKEFFARANSGAVDFVRRQLLFPLNDN
jgi:hypothetical protein